MIPMVVAELGGLRKEIIEENMKRKKESAARNKIRSREEQEV